LINGFSSSIFGSNSVSRKQPVDPVIEIAQAMVAEASQWPLVMFEEFNPSNPNHWSTNSHSFSRANITRAIDGTYRWEVEALLDVTAWAHPAYFRREKVKDFYVSVECQRISGPKDSKVGLVFRSSDGNLYIFRYRGDQRFSVHLLQHESRWTTLIPWKQSYAIKPDEVNRLTVVGEGSKFIFFINEVFVGAVVDQQLTEGGIGVAIGLHDPGDLATFEFDNFELRLSVDPSASQLQQSATPTTTSSPAPDYSLENYDTTPR
jgi:hypothetical protein